MGQRGPRMNDMICIRCNKKLEKVFDDNQNLQPLCAVHFYSYGHYGSTYFDPMDGSTLNIFVCDTCLEKNQDKLITREK